MRRGPRSRADVVVVGAGAAGIATAISAASTGASVLIVDAAHDAGGTAATAGGGLCIAGSERQRELGIDDDPASALEDWCAFGGPSVDVAWVERYLSAAVGEVQQLLGDLGVRFGEVRWNEGNRVPRWHAPLGGGRAVMTALEGRARASDRVDWSLGTALRGLIVEGGAVTGIRVSDVLAPASGVPTGAPVHEREIRAHAVVLATGGFTSDASSVRRYAADASGAPTVLLGGGRGARGEGHRVLAGLRAATVNLDAVWMYPYGLPDDLDPASGRGLAVRGLDGDIWVDRSGRRFHDETRRGGASGTPALLRQEGATCWSIIDARIAGRMAIADPRYRSGATPDRSAIAALLDRSPWVATSDSIAELGRRIDVDPVELEASVRERNAHCTGSTTDAFGRPGVAGEELVTPPFRALRFFPLARKNLGGVRTDDQTRVIGEDGRPIPGLHAVGELAGMAGGSINGRAALEGTMLGPSLFSGLVAGRSAV